MIFLCGVGSFTGVRAISRWCFTSLKHSPCRAIVFSLPNGQG